MFASQNCRDFNLIREVKFKRLSILAIWLKSIYDLLICQCFADHIFPIIAIPSKIVKYPRENNRLLVYGKLNY